LDYLEKAFFNGVCPEENVINAYVLVVNIRDDRIISACVAVTRGDVSMWSSFVAIPAPWRNEGGKTSIIWVNRYAVVSISRAKD
jgi:uncharacterized protein YbdZ (MbtH family)